MSERETVGELMRTWRRAAGINTTAAGERLGLSRRMIEDIEQGRRRAGDELSRLGIEKLIEVASSSADRRDALATDARSGVRPRATD